MHHVILSTLLAFFVLASGLAAPVDELRIREQIARDANIESVHQEKLTVLQLKYQLALEQKFQEAMESGPPSVADELRRELVSFTYDGHPIAKPRTLMLQALRRNWKLGAVRLEQERQAKLRKHYQTALRIAQTALREAPDNVAAQDYVRELELQLHALTATPEEKSQFTQWLVKQWVPSPVDHLRFQETRVFLGDREGRETDLGEWRWAPASQTVFWHQDDQLYTFVVRQGNRSGIYTEPDGTEYRLDVAPLPPANTWQEAIVGDWARLFGQGRVMRRSLFRLSLAADSTAVYGSYEPLAGQWKLTDHQLTVAYEDGTKDVIALPPEDVHALSLNGIHHDDGREWTFTLVRLID